LEEIENLEDKKPALLFRGKTLFHLGKYEEAEEAISKGLLYYPSNYELTYYKGLCRMKDFDYSKAALLFNNC